MFVKDQATPRAPAGRGPPALVSLCGSTPVDACSWLASKRREDLTVYDHRCATSADSVEPAGFRWSSGGNTKAIGISSPWPAAHARCSLDRSPIVGPATWSTAADHRGWIGLELTFGDFGRWRRAGRSGRRRRAGAAHSRREPGLLGAVRPLDGGDVLPNWLRRYSTSRLSAGALRHREAIRRSGRKASARRLRIRLPFRR